MTIQVTPPFPEYTDRNGEALDSGYIYIGTAGLNPQANPISVYFDQALSAPAAQPIRTIAGYPVNSGSPARLFVSATDYSVAVRDRAGSLVFSALANTTSLSGADIAPALFPRTSVEIALGVTPSDYSVPSHDAVGYVNPWRYLSAAQLTSVKAYNYAVDVTTPLQNAMNIAWTSQTPCYVPGGGYLVTGLTQPGQQTRRDRSFIMRGAGAGEIFDRSVDGSTVILSNTNANVLIYTPDAANTGAGQVDISYIHWVQNNAAATAAVIRFISLYDKGEFHHCNVYQGGTGDGVLIELANTIEVHHNYIISFAWNTLGLGAARVGTALKITQTIDTGLTTVRKCSLRGFKDCLIVGDGVHRNFMNHFSDCECSVYYNGVTFNVAVDNATMDNFYMEGPEGGINLLDSGNYNNACFNLMFAGFGTGIDASSTTNAGSVYIGNLISCGTTANSKLVKLGGTAKAKTCSSNKFVFGGSGGAVAGVVGLTLSGASPMFEISGNMFDPAVAWTGGAGTAQMSDGTTGTGIFGIVPINDASGIQGLKLSRGVTSSLKGATLGNGAIAATVLTLPQQNEHTITCSGGQVVNSIVIPNDGCMEISIRSTTNQITFSNTASIILEGGAAFAPPAAGGMITFRMEGSIAYEKHRRSY